MSTSQTLKTEKLETLKIKKPKISNTKKLEMFVDWGIRNLGHHMSSVLVKKKLNCMKLSCPKKILFIPN